MGIRVGSSRSWLVSAQRGPAGRAHSFPLHAGAIFTLLAKIDGSAKIAPLQGFCGPASYHRQVVDMRCVYARTFAAQLAMQVARSKRSGHRRPRRARRARAGSDWDEPSPHVEAVSERPSQRADTPEQTRARRLDSAIPSARLPRYILYLLRYRTVRPCPVFLLRLAPPPARPQRLPRPAHPASGRGGGLLRSWGNA
jgi:hypothetical protein